MRTVELTLDGHLCSGTPELGTSLRDFLSNLGLQVGELLFDKQGEPVSTRYTLAHSVHGQCLVENGEVGAAVPALTLNEILATPV